MKFIEVTVSADAAQLMDENYPGSIEPARINPDGSRIYNINEYLYNSLMEKWADPGEDFSAMVLRQMPKMRAILELQAATIEKGKKAIN